MLTIYFLCLGALVTILSGLSGLGMCTKFVIAISNNLN
jgi:hypothetical protein